MDTRIAVWLSAAEKLVQRELDTFAKVCSGPSAGSLSENLAIVIIDSAGLGVVVGGPSWPAEVVKGLDDTFARQACCRAMMQAHLRRCSLKMSKCDLCIDRTQTLVQALVFPKRIHHV